MLLHRPVLLFGLTLAGVSAGAATCESLARLSLPATAISVAELVPAGLFAPPGGKPIPNLPAFCRVAGSIKPSSDSDIQFEVWMPASGWNRRFLGIGNGGYAGSIGFGGLAAAVAKGYASAATDTGHRAGGTDANWALGHPEKVIDFGYRAIHETAVQGKAIVRAFYGEQPRRSYFSSCSNGGRQALMEAQRFPHDYDGIIAGAPANYWTRLLSTAVWDVQATMSEPASYISASKLPAIQAASLATCDANDGVKDGVIENPAQCRFDPSKLLCNGPESDQCLTAPQLAALKKIYSGPADSKGEPAFPGYPGGGEAGAGGWGAWITGNGPGKSLMYAFGTQFYLNIVFSDPAWDFRTFQLDRDLKTAEEKFARVLNSTDPDLKRFRDRGGRLILYHGWCDAAIPAPNTINYYRSVEAKMGADRTRSFVRLYMVPGMQHCSGGRAPNSFGQGGPPQGDPRSNIAASLERWVEDGVAPGPIVATLYKTGTNPASGVVRTRPLCPYPRVAKWNGTGSTDEAANFTCVAP